MTSLYIGANHIGPGSEDQSDCSKFQNDPTLALRGQNDPTLVISLSFLVNQASDLVKYIVIFVM